MVVDLPTKILASLFDPLMSAGLHSHSLLLTLSALNASDWPRPCRERLLINEYFTMLASLEYNMQEMYRAQKLANDLVDITVTVTNDTLLYLIKRGKYREKECSVFLSCNRNTGGVQRERKCFGTRVYSGCCFSISTSFIYIFTEPSILSMFIPSFRVFYQDS